jgi:hypothetical protein
MNPPASNSGKRLCPIPLRAGPRGVDLGRADPAPGPCRRQRYRSPGIWLSGGPALAIPTAWLSTARLAPARPPLSSPDDAQPAGRRSGIAGDAAHAAPGPGALAPIAALPSASSYRLLGWCNASNLGPNSSTAPETYLVNQASLSCKHSPRTAVWQRSPVGEGSPRNSTAGAPGSGERGGPTRSRTRPGGGAMLQNNDLV